MKAFLSSAWAGVKGLGTKSIPWVVAHKSLAIGIGAILFTIILMSITLHSCKSQPVAIATPPSSPEVGYFFWKICFSAMLVMTLIAYKYKPDNRWIPFGFMVGAGIIFLVLINKISIFEWAVLGLPFMVFGSIWVYNHVQPAGRIHRFIGFTIGLIITFWLYLFIQANIHPNLDFLGDRITDPVNLIIFFLAAGLFGFAIWKHSKVFYLLSFLVLASWLGNDVFKGIKSRYPNMLKVSVLVPESVKPTAEKVSNAVGKTVEAFTSILEAKADRSALGARKDAQAQRIWLIKAGTVVYKYVQEKKVLEPLNIEYTNDTEVISLGESIELNGILFEFCALPDAKSGQRGRWRGWVCSLDLAEKPMVAATPAADSAEKSGRQPVAVVASSQNRFANALPGGITIGPGSYYQEPVEKTSFQFAGESSPRIVGNGKYFTILPGQKVVGIRTDHNLVTIYRKEV